jgi:tetratricopeptide (TPR) repeat protein
MQLQIWHIENPTGNPQFEIVCMTNGKHSEAVRLTPPDEIMVKPHNITLQHGLQWYLEKYLELPIEAFQTRAESIQEALRLWGKETFKTLFDSGLARDWYQQGWREGPASLDIKVISDDPAVLAWPWEALESETDGCLALKCHIERQLCKIADARLPANSWPQNQLNILYIIARPHGEDDVGFQTLARPLIDFAFARDESWPVHIDLLRPPTFDQLRTVLREKPGFYHIVHFDGHGGYGYRDTQNRINAMNEKFSGAEGLLIFEKESGDGGESISAEMLGELLSEHNIPVMVLNACQSAMVDEQAKTPFASVASSLIKAGIYSVVAMSYSLWVSGAKKFLPGFYRQLFTDGNVAEALRLGRQEMYRNNMRDSFIGKVKFNDWIVPVLYQQLPYENSVLPKLLPGENRTSNLPKEVLELEYDDFIGRDRAVLRLEQAVQRQPQAGILIHGISGEGKTTLAKGFLRWLEDTNGLGSGAFWFSFEDIHSADYIIEILADRLFGTRTLALPQEEKISAIVKKLKAERFFLVWDNFESASGIPGTEVSGLISEEGRQMLKQFLHELRGGRTKVLITSRSEEGWLAVQACFRLSLGGLRGEELWQYCDAVVAELGLTLNREDKSCQDLLDRLDGNPLALRAVLLRLKECTAAALLAELQESFNGLEGDEATKRIQAALAVFERGLDRAFAPVLRLLGLHDHFADKKLVGFMLNEIKSEAETYITNNCFAALESAGLCRHIGNALYKLHPALHSCLARLYPAEEAGKRVFVELMSSLANVYASKELHEQRGVFLLFGANFRRALGIARELDMREAEMYLIEGLAHYVGNTRDFKEAERLYRELAGSAQNYSNMKMEAVAYHQLGMVAQQRRDFTTAEDWYKKSMEINQKLGNEYRTAGIYHQLGMVAEERRDFTTAEDWYRKSLEIEQRFGDEHGLAITYHQLGIVAHRRRDFTAAEDWYRKSLEITQRLGDEYHMALVYHQLGMIADERCDFTAAEDWYKKSLEIGQRLGDEHGMALTYHQLGTVAYQRGDFTTAEDWYRKSLEIKQRLGDEYRTASTYYQLGMVAREQHDFTAAEDWYRKSLEITQRLGDEYRVASNYHQLGRVAEERRNFIAAEDRYKKALVIFERLGEKYGIEIVKESLDRLQALKEDN